MKVGIDFDNTLVSYESVFHKVALEKGYIDAGVSKSKLAVRENLRARDMEDVWTELQGYVYGACMDQADIFPCVIETLSWARENSVEVAIVSHKTRFPYLGPAYDLHRAAGEWIEKTLRDADGPLVCPEHLYFREAVDEKIACIAEIGCDVFIDDLPEILLAPTFPTAARRYLFDPDGVHAPIEGIVSVASWIEFLEHLKR